MQALTVPLEVSSADRLGVTIFFSILAHLIVILGVTFSPEDPPPRRVETLDVVLVPLPSETAPDRPDYLGQANREGGGDSTGMVRPATPLASPVESSEPAAAAAEPAVATDDATDAPRPGIEPARSPAPASSDGAAIAAISPGAPFAEPSPVEPHPAQAVPAEEVPAEAEARTRRALAMAALEAEIERDLQAYAERPRRRWISASTREHKFAAYMDAWRRKVEQVGNLNYPEEAERRGLTGDLLLEVAIRPDGTVEEITLRRSSGERVLDEAAVRIMEIAAPFGAFPEDIAEDVDILHIERTWIFHSGGATMSR